MFARCAADCPNRARRANAHGLSFGQSRDGSREPNCNGLCVKCRTKTRRGKTARPLAGREARMSRMLDGVGRLIARYLQKPVHGYEPFTPSDPDALRAIAAARRRAAGRGQQPHLRRHQISDPIDLVAFGALCRADRGPRHGGRRAACADRGQCRRRRRFGAAVEIFPLSHPHLPAGRLDRRPTVQRCALMRSSASASPTI